MLWHCGEYGGDLPKECERLHVEAVKMPCSPQLLHNLPTTPPQVLHDFSTTYQTYPQLLLNFSTAFPQHLHDCSTTSRQLLHSLTAAAQLFCNNKMETDRFMRARHTYIQLAWAYINPGSAATTPAPTLHGSLCLQRH